VTEGSMFWFHVDKVDQQGCPCWSTLSASNQSDWLTACYMMWCAVAHCSKWCFARCFWSDADSSWFVVVANWLCVLRAVRLHR